MAEAKVGLNLRHFGVLAVGEDHFHPKPTKGTEGQSTLGAYRRVSFLSPTTKLRAIAFRQNMNID